MSDHFPREIWVQILHKLPLKSLVKCTSVCKAWNSLITDHAFICDHLIHTIQASNCNPFLFLQLYTATGDLPVEILEYDEFYCLYSDNEEIHHHPILRLPFIDEIRLFGYSKVVGTCNGLVCFAHYSVLDGATQIIWNPSIRKYVVLPKPSVTFKNDHRIDEKYRVVYGFGFDSRNKDFKLVRLVTLRRKENTPHVEVYSLASSSWRSITASIPPFLFKNFWAEECTHQMFINGVLHWIVNRTINGQIHYFILTFDVSEEKFGGLMLPQCVKESPFHVSILAGGGSLAVLHRNGSDFRNKLFSIWVMKEYGAVESWTQVFHSDSTQYGGISSVLALRSTEEVVLESSTLGIVLLDPMKESVKKLGFKRFFIDYVGYHVQSLFLINKEHDVLSY